MKTTTDNKDPIRAAFVTLRMQMANGMISDAEATQTERMLHTATRLHEELMTLRSDLTSTIERLAARPLEYHINSLGVVQNSHLINAACGVYADRQEVLRQLKRESE